MIWRIILCLFVGYAFGCISTGLIVGKVKKVDIRNYGSGNVGTTNALRTLGVKAGLITFLGDVLKCVLPIILMKYIVFRDVDYRILIGVCTGLGAVLGHNFPFYLHFKGGKGIAVTAATILMVFDLWLILLCLVSFVVCVAITRYVSLGSLIIVSEFFLWTLIFYGIRGGDWPLVIVSAIFTMLAFYTHRTNIKRLLSGTENKIGAKKKVEATNDGKENA